ncbi:MAG: hypothetical protein Q8K02_13355 [Flavobacterium sp.]|nr:hypothetical protein [Flavobacterium sp.]
MMKQVSLLFYILVLYSCKQNEAIKNDDVVLSNKRNHSAELIEKEFLKYADEAMVDSLKMELINAFNIYDDSFFKIVHIDAEALAEFSFDFFLPNLNTILAKRNSSLTVKKSNDNYDSFEVLINGQPIQLYTQLELDNDSFWNTAPINFFRKVNTILKANDSNEQFYLLYEGNDLHAILLTEDQFFIITDYYKDNFNERPYKP